MNVITLVFFCHIVVIWSLINVLLEFILCSLQVTLSGFLNFIDGLWSSCGDERIIVFTANHKDKLDPALLRPGRMDVHIAMSYCTPCAFKMLASNYLGITEHPLFVEVDKLLQTTNVTPAEVGEHFLKNEDPEIALRSLIELLVEKGRNHESKAIKADLTTTPLNDLNPEIVLE